MNRIDELVSLIEYHNKLYWDKGITEISDIEYDAFVNELISLDANNPIINQIHTPNVESSKKVKHNTPMLSLNKAYTLEEILEWATKQARSQDENFLIQPKYDGISANYADGILSTRGNGLEGEDITDKIPLIELESKGYVGKINNQKPFRGEIVIRNDDFENLYSKIRRKGGELYKNSRNAVAGIMGLKDITNAKRQGAKVTLIDYDLISYESTLAEFANSWDKIHNEMMNLIYPLDGIVIKLADKEYLESLGNTAHHPRGQIAFKFSGIRKKSKLINVKWSFGKNCLTPVAEIEPVEIGGVTIRNATLHNVQNIIDKDIQIGDIVTLERAGDVIPYIIKSEPCEERKNPIITECPSCNQILTRQGPELICTNKDCFEINIQRLLAAVRNLGIERLGEPNVRRMMQSLSVKTINDIFKLSVDDILKLEGYQKKSANNLYTEIQKRKTVNDFQLLASLNINGIGQTVGKVILQKYSLSELRNLNSDDLSEINGIGPERAKAIEKELKEQSEFIDELLLAINLIETKNSEIIASETICFTGKMPEKRAFYEALAKEKGLTPASKVSKTLSILVAVDIEGNSSKIKNAKKYGVKLISLEDWLNEDIEEHLGNKSKIEEEDYSEGNKSEIKENDYSDLELFN